MNDDLKFDFEANLQPLVKAVADATRILTSLERKMVSVAKAGNLSATRADVSKFTSGLSQVQTSLRTIEASLQRLPNKGITDLTGPTKLATDAVKQLNMSLNALKQTNDLNSSALSGVNIGLSVASKQYGAAAAEVLKLASATRDVPPTAKQAADAAKNLGDKSGEASVEVEELGKDLDKTSKSASAFSSVGAVLTKTLSRVTRAIKLLIMAKLGRFFSQAMKESIEYAENLNLFNVAMGTSIDKGKEFTKTIQEQYGLDPSNIMRYTGVFYQLASAIEVADETAAVMSMGLTKVGVDLSSLFNMPIDTVMQNLQSGMQGMTRAVRKYGIDIRVSTLQQEAFNIGMKGSILTMSEANRQGLRYLTILKQTSKATGDFAKTIESPANQLRILQEQVQQLARAVGNLLLGAFSSVLPYINGVVMALRMVLQALAALMGFKPLDFGGATDEAEDLRDSLSGGVGGALDDVAKKAKKLLAPFDELNVLSAETAGNVGGGGGIDMGVMDANLQKIIAEYELRFEGIRMKANQVRDAILEFLGLEMEFDADGNLVRFNFSLEKLVENFKNATGINLQPLIDAFERFKTSLAPFTTAIGEGLKWFLDNVLAPLAAWTIEDLLPAFLDLLGGALELLGALLETFKPLLEWLLKDFLLPVAAWTGNVAVDALTGLGDALGAIGTWCSENQTIVNSMVAAIGMLALELALASGAQIVLKLEAMKTSVYLAGQFVIGVAKAGGALALATGKAILFNIQMAWIAVKAGVAMTAQALLTGATAAWTTVCGIATGVTAAFGTAMAFLAANPIVLVIAAIAALVAGIIYLIANWDTVGPKVAAAVDAMKAALKPVSDWFKNVVINPMIKFLNGLMKAAIDIVNRIIEALNTIQVSIPDWVPLIGGKSFGVNLNPVAFNAIPELASGGIVRDPTLAMIGEGKYDEAVIPLGDSPQMAELLNKFAEVVGGQGGGEVNVTVNAILDGEVIYTNQQKVKQNRGYDFGLGAFAR